MDYYSNFFEVMKLTSTKTPTIIKHCKTTFARHGIPDVLISDNCPQFDNAEFKQFAKEWTFTHQTSSSHYPKSNGLAESNNPDLKESPKEGTARKEQIPIWQSSSFAIHQQTTTLVHQLNHFFVIEPKPCCQSATSF